MSPGLTTAAWTPAGSLFLIRTRRTGKTPLLNLPYRAKAADGEGSSVSTGRMSPNFPMTRLLSRVAAPRLSSRAFGCCLAVAFLNMWLLPWPVAGRIISRFDPIQKSSRSDLTLNTGVTLATQPANPSGQLVAGRKPSGAESREKLLLALCSRDHSNGSDG